MLRVYVCFFVSVVKSAAKIAIFYVLTTFLPKYFTAIVNIVYCAGQYEKIIAEPVDVAYDGGIDISCARERYDAPFGAPGHSARYVGVCRVGVAAGKDKAVVARVCGIEDVDVVFEGIDSALRQRCGLPCAVGLGGENGAYVEKGVLDALQGVAGAFGEGVGGGEETEVRVEFVDGAVGFKARVVFGDASASDERCHAFVASACVDVAFGHCFCWLDVRNSE